MINLNDIQQKLNLTSANINIISDNIANVNTPNYKRRYIDVQRDTFTSKLETTLKKTNEKHLDSSKNNGYSEIEVEAYMRTDNNGVDIDNEVVEMNKNKLFYSSLVQLINNDINKARTVITSK